MLINYDHLTPRNKTVADVGLLLARIPIGILFFLAGINKIRGGVGVFVKEHIHQGPLPQGLTSAYLHALPFFEVIVGACLILGLFTGIIALIAFFMLLSFTIAATGWTDARTHNLAANVVYMGLTIALSAIGPGRLSADVFIFGKRDRRIT